MRTSFQTSLRRPWEKALCPSPIARLLQSEFGCRNRTLDSLIWDQQDHRRRGNEIKETEKIKLPENFMHFPFKPIRWLIRTSKSLRCEWEAELSFSHLLCPWVHYVRIHLLMSSWWKLDHKNTVFLYRETRQYRKIPYKCTTLAFAIE